MINNILSPFKQISKDQEKRIKRQKHRFMVLDEWVRTEKKYITDLNIIMSKILTPMRQKQLITAQEERIIFCNFNSLIALSQQILISLESFINQWKPSTVIISDKLLKIYAFFKIYSEYCNNYQKGQKILARLENDETYQSIQKQLPGGLDINSYLIKPIQRPPKYLLFLKDYRSKMQIDHPDYYSLGQVIEKYDQVIKINNNAIQTQNRQNKIIELQKLYNDLIEVNRQFLRQFNGSTISQKIKIYVLTDLILITKKLSKKEQLKQIIELDGMSYLHKQEDGKYFQNKLFVCGKYQCIHIIFESQYEIFTFYQFLTQVIQNIFQIQQNRANLLNLNKSIQKTKVKMTLNKNNIDLPELKISIIGVEKRPLSALKNQTVYIIKYETYKKSKICQYVYTRFSFLQQLHNDLVVNYQSIPSLNPQLSQINIYDEKTNKTKIIQYRTILIVEFLNFIIRNTNIMQNPIPIVQKLKISQNLFKIAIKNNNLKQECCPFSHKNQNFPTSFDQYLNQRYKYVFSQRQKFCMHKFVKSQETIKKYDKSLCNTLQKVILYLNAIQGRLDHLLIKNPSKQDYIIKIYYYHNINQEQLQIKIDKYTTVNQLMAMIQKQLSVKNLRDFGLFLEYESIPRLLDEDQIIFDIIQQIQGQIQDIQNELFSFFTSSCTKIKEVVTGKKSKLILKKYYFLSYDFERNNRQSDFEKFKLIIGQIFHYIQQEIITLKDEELLKFLSYYMLIKQPQKLYCLKKQNFPQNLVIQCLKQFNKAAVLYQVQIRKIIDYVRIIKLEFDNKKDNFKLFLYRKIIQLIENNINWNSCLFPVTNHDPQTLKGKSINLSIGINHKFIYLIEPRACQPIQKLVIPLQNFEYQITPFSISFNYNNIKYRFDGRLLYNLSKLLNQYLLYNKIFFNIGRSRQSSEKINDLKQTKNHF